jgi:hypothetical protein
VARGRRGGLQTADFLLKPLLIGADASVMSPRLPVVIVNGPLALAVVLPDSSVVLVDRLLLPLLCLS